MTNPIISLLVPTMNNPWHLEQTIKSALQNCNVEIEILIFSNEHYITSDTDNLFLELNAKSWITPDGLNEIKIIQMYDRNVGVAKAVNALAAEAKGDFLFYTADDAYLLPGWDIALLKRVSDNPWQYLTPRSIEPRWNNPCMYSPHNFGRNQDNFKRNELEDFWETLPKQDVISCAGPPFVSKWLFDEVGGFDEQYWPGFGTDPDFAHAIYSTAKAVGEIPEFLGVGDSGFYHFQCITTERISRRDYRDESQRIFSKKWGRTTREFGKLIGDGTPIIDGKIGPIGCHDAPTDFGPAPTGSTGDSDEPGPLGTPGVMKNE